MKIRIFLVCSSFMLLAVGCSTSSPPTDSNVEQPSSISISQTALPSLTSEVNGSGYTPTPFPIPTLSLTQHANLERLLSSEACNLPCYLGIEPGKATFDEAGRIITDMGGTVRADYENFYEGFPERPPLRLRSYILNLHGSDKTIYQDINITAKNSLVQQISVNVFSNFQAQFYETWRKYSVKSIFERYGEPDRILIHAGNRDHALRITYLDYGTVLEWSGTHNENSLDYKMCLEFSKENIVNLMIAVADTKSAFEILPSSYVGTEEMWNPTHETLGISEKEFYERIIFDSTACFDVIGTK